eukprot:3754261-Prymnesium_polylepis.2
MNPCTGHPPRLFRAHQRPCRVGARHPAPRGSPTRGASFCVPREVFQNWDKSRETPGTPGTPCRAAVVVMAPGTWYPRLAGVFEAA